MLGPVKRRESKLFYAGLNLEERVPADHPLRRVARAIDFGFVREEVAGCYGYNGQESVDPTVILKLLFLAFLEKVRSEREMMRQLPLRLDWLWFCELDVDDEIPDHSVLSKARRRWGVETFERIFAHVLGQCVKAGLVDGQTVYADSTVLKANAAVDSRVPRKLWAQLERAAPMSPGREDRDDEGGEGDGGRDDDGGGDDQDAAKQRREGTPADMDPQKAQLPPPPTGRFNARTVSRSDPEAATTSRRGREVKLGYRDHALVDDRRGVVLATIATAADYDDAALLTPLLNKCQQYLQRGPQRAVADSMYGTKSNIHMLRWRGVEPYLKRRPAKNDHRHWLDRLPEECDPALALRLMKRRLHIAEGRFADAHVRHEHRRCRWRGRWRVQIQCYLVAMTQNIRKLVRYALPPGGLAQGITTPSSGCCPAWAVVRSSAITLLWLRAWERRRMTEA